MSIRIVNLRSYRPVDGEVLIKVDRSSVVGNPFFMRSESERDAVCDKYSDYFKKQIVENEKFLSELRNIFKAAKQNNIALGCWCSPKRCHAETIKSYIESFM